MKREIIQGLLNSCTYSEYRKSVADLLNQGRSSGNEQSEDHLYYSQLNQTRMNRLDKTLQVPEEILDKLKSIKKEYTWLVLAEGWCGDVAQIAPILYKISSVSDKINLRFVFRDANDPLMNCFLTNDARAIPKLIILDNENNELKGTWGPRPEGATNLIKSYKAQYGVVDQTAKKELQLWYLHDKGKSTMEELISIMMRIEELASHKIN
ncbi:thioredoxin family protein [Flavobacterium oreochromis]|uniref:Thioredoxin family protein n=2 Tax=Flavobacterium TaxID=237 RepID=A0A246GEJ3_9FLAO|nr:thioredoxin family protein [Flavobacterium oreochromis]OWP79104.1 thioredoxin family protein [Flavobacterium oreochromis]OWP79809.1 thioredoxin family protein [Flavobacterium oreochromis]POR30695.1 thioredoxin family protein [Flavobacterium columnare]